MARDAGAPFFVYLNYSRPHVPLHPDQARTAAYAAEPAFQNSDLNPEYAAEIEAIDKATAALLRKLDSLALSSSTVVIFASDNGGFLGRESERIADTAPLRDGKASLYEGGIRVPAIVRWPGVVQPGSTSEQPVHWIDWHATLATIAGGTVPVGLDGVSFTSALRGENPSETRALFWHNPHYRRALAGVSASPSSAVRDGDWKLLHFYETDSVELYNLREDLGEVHDLSRVHPEKTVKLRRLLDSWRGSVAAQPPVPNRAE
jgi:arylsulfatase A-like enzyme